MKPFVSTLIAATLAAGSFAAAPHLFGPDLNWRDGPPGFYYQQNPPDRATIERSAKAILSEAVMLVATPRLQHPLYGNAVLIVKPFAGRMHVGFIVNKPTRITLGDAFPDHEPSRHVRGPVYLGGPLDVNVVFALVQRHDSPGQGSVQLTDDLFVAIAGVTVDKIIAAESDRARFLFGTVIWRAGELQEEVHQGMWYVMEPESDLLVRKNTAGLWEELVRRSEQQKWML